MRHTLGMTLEGLVMQDSPARKRWLLVVAIVAGVLVLTALALVFLVLTGIIAEPETVIEGIVRALLGH